MVVPSLEYSWPDVIAGARAAADEHGARILLRGSADDGGEGDHAQIARLLHAAGVEGSAGGPGGGGPHRRPPAAVVGERPRPDDPHGARHPRRRAATASAG
ncbi:hypothetical protein [Cellulomonas endophytica]|uniref:hypothetical protein n=1 Tax=Cellulomonas endophytica TaxID=2494735 RepID=UPI001011FC1A|nr:hypothetical protein [Cellulomonas endophytica]